MSRVTKSELLEENRLMKNIMVQIHNLTVPFVDLNANEPPQTVKVAEKVTTNQRKKATSKRKVTKPTSILTVPDQKPLPVNGNTAAIRRPSTSGAKETSIIMDTSSEMDRTSNPDDLLHYLRLQKVLATATPVPKTRSTDESQQTSKTTSSKGNPSKRLSMVNLGTTVTVVIDRLTPAEIIKASRGPSVSLKRPSNRPEPRRTYPRKAAPTNLKELTLQDLKKAHA